jgi:hypothetical protein
MWLHTLALLMTGLHGIELQFLIFLVKTYISGVESVKYRQLSYTNREEWRAEKKIVNLRMKWLLSLSKSNDYYVKAMKKKLDYITLFRYIFITMSEDERDE